MTSRTPIDIVTLVFDDLARSDVTAAVEYFDDDIVWTNVSLPTIRGKRKVAKAFGAIESSASLGFNYRMTNIAADGAVVLTERIDELRVGRLRLQFWVCGRFEIREGRVAVWRDYFDFFDMTKSLVRGLVALVLPAVQRPLPAPGPKIVPTAP